VYRVNIGFDSGGGGGGSGDSLISTPGEFSVSSGAALRNLVYALGGTTVGVADNSSISLAPVMGVITGKPTSTTATIIFIGKVDGFSGMTPAAQQFLGSSGGLIEVGSLPTSAGSVIQNVGFAISNSVLFFDPKPPIIL